MPGVVQALANLNLVVKGVKCNAVLLIKQVCSLCPDHQNCSPSVVTSERFWIEALFHHCKPLYKLPQHAYPYPKKTKILEHAVRNICFNCIIQWIVKPDREQERRLPCRCHHIAEAWTPRIPPRSSFLAQCAPFPMQCIKELNHGRNHTGGRHHQQ